MRILHVIHTLNPSFGGPPRVAVRLAAGQASLGHDVTIVTYRLTDPPDHFREMTGRLPGFDRVRVVEVESGGPWEALFAARARPVLLERTEAADIVHLHNVWDSLLRVAGAVARRAGKPYVLQPNDILNPWSLRQKRLKKRIALAVGYRRMIEGSAGVIFGHSEERRLVDQNGFRINPFVAWLGGVFREEVEPVPAHGAFYRRVPGLRGRPFVVFLSRLHHKKGLDFLAEGFAFAAHRVPDLQLVVIGHDEGARLDFQRRIAGHGLTDRVHLLGPMHGEAKWEAFRDATCFCLPSRDEAFTVAIIEALSIGLPVVISDACHFGEIREYEAGFIEPLDANRIGVALARLGADPGLRDHMSLGARRLFVERLCFDRVANEVIEVYARCLADRSWTARINGATCP